MANPTKERLAAEIYQAAEKLGADEALLSILGDYAILSDEEVLTRLRAYNVSRLVKVTHIKIFGQDMH